MCFDPVSIGLLVAGTAASMAGSSIARKESEEGQAREVAARNATLREQQARARRFAEENEAVTKRTVDRFAEPEQKKITDNVNAQRDATIDRTVVPTAGVDDIPLDTDGPQIIKSGIAKKMLDAFKKSTDNAKLAARVGAYGDVGTQNNLNMIDAGRKVDTVNSFARQEAAMLPSQQELAALTVRRPPSGTGQLLSGLGSLMASVGGSGIVRRGVPLAPTTLTMMPADI